MGFGTKLRGDNTQAELQSLSMRGLEKDKKEGDYSIWEGWGGWEGQAGNGQVSHVKGVWNVSPEQSVVEVTVLDYVSQC